MKILFLISTLAFSACDYQEAPLQGVFSSSQGAEAVSEKDKEGLDENVQEEEFTEDFQKYLDLFVLKNPNSREYDTLVDYQLIAKYKKQLKTNDPSPEALEYGELSQKITSYFAFLDLKELPSKEARIANMINAYNFFVIEVIAEHYPIKQIKNISKDGEWEIFSRNAFLFANQKISLNYLEKFLLYNELTIQASSTKDPDNFDRFTAIKTDARPHFAVICGAKGCPILSQEMYRADTLDQQLDDITIKGLKLKRNFIQQGNIYKTTLLFSWYDDDFKTHVPTGETKAVGSSTNFINHYLRLKTAGKIQADIDYDWDLNIK